MLYVLCQKQWSFSGVDRTHGNSFTHSDTVLTSDAAVLGESLGFFEEVKTFQAVVYESATERRETSNANVPDHAFRLMGINCRHGQISRVPL